MEYATAADAALFTCRTRQKPGETKPVISPGHESERNPVFYDADLLSAGVLFRRRALRARLPTRPGRGGFRSLYHLRPFIGMIELIGPLHSSITSLILAGSTSIAMRPS